MPERRMRVLYRDPSNLSLSEKILMEYDASAQMMSIDDMLEYFCIIQYFDKKVYLDSWDEQAIMRFRSIIKTLKARLGRHFHAVNGDTFSAEYDSVCRSHRSVYLEALVYYKVIDRISDSQMRAFLEAHSQLLTRILQRKAIVKRFGIVITDYIVNHIEMTETIIKHYFERRDESEPETYMPEELSSDMKNTIIQKYIDWDDAHPSYLNLISGLKKAGDFRITDKMRLKAKRRYVQFVNEQFQKGASVQELRGNASFDKQDEVIIAHREPFQISYSYSIDWIDENLDYPTLMNNFIHLFKYTDNHCRCRFLSNPANIGPIEGLMGLHGKTEYAVGAEYHMSHISSSNQMYAYQEVLRQRGIEIESLYKWFFEEYLPQEFGVDGFKYVAPSTSASNLEKILVMTSQIDAVIKQYRLYLEDQSIDRDLFEFSSMPYKIVDTPSMIDEKYAYVVSREIKEAMHLLFSDQCMLSYTDSTKDKYHNFASLLLNERIKREDISEWNQKDLAWLFDKDYVYEGNNGYLHIRSAMVSLLADLYNNGSIVIPYCKGDKKTFLDQLIARKELQVESKLFTKQEQDYLDYMLNVQQFTNGPELRNKYVHGTFSLRPEMHKSDYIELLKIMVLIIIKINEEFCLTYPENENRISRKQK